MYISTPPISCDITFTLLCWIFCFRFFMFHLLVNTLIPSTRGKDKGITSFWWNRFVKALLKQKGNPSTSQLKMHRRIEQTYRSSKSQGRIAFSHFSRASAPRSPRFKESGVESGIVGISTRRRHGVKRSAPLGFESPSGIESFTVRWATSRKTLSNDMIRGGENIGARTRGVRGERSMSES